MGSNRQNYQHASYKPCHNYVNYQVCNWMIPSDEDEEFCESCQLTHVIPDLENSENLIYWFRLEEAKRRFLYLAQRMNMMPRPKSLKMIHLVCVLIFSCPKKTSLF